MKKLLLLLLLVQTAAWATTVRLETNLGPIDIELYDQQTPNHVTNFLNYVSDGDYNDTVIHRSVPGFVIQGGGYKFVSGVFETIPTEPEIGAELGISNTRGTVALAKIGSHPSGDSQWFINLANNAYLDTNSGGYTVFGKVTEQTMSVVDLIASLRIVNEIPLLNQVNGQNIQANNLVQVERAYVINNGFVVNSAISGGWYSPSTVGQGFYFEMLPASHVLVSAWFTYEAFSTGDDVESIIGNPDQRWITSQGEFDGNTVSGPIYSTSNGLFDSPDVVDVDIIGQLTIEFLSCVEGIVSYELDAQGLSGSFPITRLSGDNVALCEQLSISDDVTIR